MLKKTGSGFHLRTPQRGRRCQETKKGTSKGACEEGRGELEPQFKVYFLYTKFLAHQLNNS